MVDLILGLDVSTACTGVCLLRTDGTVEYSGYVELAKHKNLHDKRRRVAKEVRERIGEGNVVAVVVEEPLQGYRSGLTSASTLSLLNMFNGMIQATVADSLGYSGEVSLIDSGVARRGLGIKVLPEKKCGVPTKEQVVTWVERAIGEALPPSRRSLASGPRKGELVFDSRSADAADAYVVAEYHRRSLNTTK